MIAKYKNKYYKANKQENTIILLLPQNASSPQNIDGFISKKDYWYKKISIYDNDLSELYELHYFVVYLDNFEKQRIWKVDFIAPPAEKAILLNNEVVITIDHCSKNDSWKNYDKCEAMKIVKLQDCEKYIKQIIYYKQNKTICNNIHYEFLNMSSFIIALSNDIY